MKILNSKFYTLGSHEKVYEQKICQIEEIVTDLNSTGKNNTKENNEVRSLIKDLIDMKNNSANENEVNRNRVQRA